VPRGKKISEMPHLAKTRQTILYPSTPMPIARPPSCGCPGIHSECGMVGASGGWHEEYRGWGGSRGRRDFVGWSGRDNPTICIGCTEIVWLIFYSSFSALTYISMSPREYTCSKIPSKASTSFLAATWDMYIRVPSRRTLSSFLMPGI